MNLYAIQPDHSPDSPALQLGDTPEDALWKATIMAAEDMTDGYGSPTATVYLVAADLPVVGQARAADLLQKCEWWPPDDHVWPGQREKLARRVGEWEGWKRGCEDAEDWQSARNRRG